MSQRTIELSVTAAPMPQLYTRLPLLHQFPLLMLTVGTYYSSVARKRARPTTGTKRKSKPSRSHHSSISEISTSRQRGQKVTSRSPSRHQWGSGRKAASGTASTKADQDKVLNARSAPPLPPAGAVPAALCSVGALYIVTHNSDVQNWTRTNTLYNNVRGSFLLRWTKRRSAVWDLAATL